MIFHQKFHGLEGWDDTSQDSALPSGSATKDPPAVQETQVQSLGRDDSLEEGMATHSSVFAWRIPRTEAIAPRVAKSGTQLKSLSTHILRASSVLNTRLCQTLPEAPFSAATLPNTHHSILNWDGTISSRLLFLFFATPRSLWDFSSLTRD